MVKVALVVDDTQGIEIFRILQTIDEIGIMAVADLSGDASWLTGEERKNYFVTSDLAKIASMPDLQVVLNAAGSADIAEHLRKKLNKSVELVSITADSFLMNLLRFREQLLETRLLKEELQAILNAVQDPIEAVDARGVIKYVNPAFTRVTGIPENERVNRNIFEVSPHGALAQSLISQKPVIGYRTTVGGSDAEVVSNASPIIVDGEIKGAVVVFQHVNDILKLMDQLKYSNEVIENLYARIGRISGSRWSFDELTGESKSYRAAVEMGRKAARSENPVLILGESGTGKEVFAEAIHNSSNRRGKLFIKFDCAEIPEDLQEIELFGCEKGALPGVVRTRLGKVELARGGTLYLKDIASLSHYLQDKLAAMLREEEFCRIGGETPIKSDVRLIASAGLHFKPAVLNGTFREELYHLINGFELVLPPLRKRVEDLPLLAKNLIERYNRKLGKQVREISPRAMQGLMDYDWPGNINEFRNVMERAMVVADGPVIEYSHLSPYIGKMDTAITPLFNEIMPLDKMEQILLKLALNRYGTTLEGKKKAAQALNISLATLYNKLKKYKANF